MMYNMKRRTYYNVLRSTKIIAAKGYDWKTANDIAIRCWDDFEMSGGAVTVEWLLSRVVSREEYERDWSEKTSDS